VSADNFDDVSNHNLGPLQQLPVPIPQDLHTHTPTALMQSKGKPGCASSGAQALGRMLISHTLAVEPVGG